MSDWMWFVIRKSDNNQWSILAGPFANNKEAFDEAKRKADTFKGNVFVVESTHVAHSTAVEFRSVKP